MLRDTPNTVIMEMLDRIKDDIIAVFTGKVI